MTKPVDGADALVEKVARAIDPDAFMMPKADTLAIAAWQGRKRRATDKARAVLALPDLRLAGVKEGLEMEHVREAGSFLLDRLVDHEVRMTSDEDAREWHGHVTPAMARFRTAIRSLGPRP